MSLIDVESPSKKFREEELRTFSTNCNQVKDVASIKQEWLRVKWYVVTGSTIGFTLLV